MDQISDHADNRMPKASITRREKTGKQTFSITMITDLMELIAIDETMKVERI